MATDLRPRRSPVVRAVQAGCVVVALLVAAAAPNWTLGVPAPVVSAVHDASMSPVGRWPSVLWTRFAASSQPDGDVSDFLASVDVATQNPPQPSTLRVAQVAPRIAHGSAAVCASDPMAGALLLDGAAVTVMDDEFNVIEDHSGDSALTSASIAKIVTATAALSSLGADTTIATRALVDATGTVTLVGGGDPTLSDVADNWYGSGDRIGSIADGVRAWAQARGIAITRVVSDASLFSGSSWQSVWDPAFATEGYEAPVSALSLAGGRQNARLEYSPRTQDPAAAAGQALATRLGVAYGGAGAADAAAEVAAESKSQSILELVQFMLRHSDNDLAESLARLSAIAHGGEGSFEGIDETYRSVLDVLGIDAGESHFADGSGLSWQTQIAPHVLADLLSLSKTSPEIVPVASLLSQPGQGTLEHRFEDLNDDERARIHAKTGTLNGFTSLAGWVQSAVSDRTLQFAIIVPGEQRDLVRKDLDAFVESLQQCG